MSALAAALLLVAAVTAPAPAPATAPATAPAATPAPTVAASPLPTFAPLSDAEIAELTALLPYLGDGAEPVPSLAAASTSCPVRVLASGRNFRRDPEHYRDAFYAALAIDDYAERGAGRYRLVDVEWVSTIIDSASAAPPALRDDRVSSAIGFCALKDRNLWVDSSQGRVSLARIIRGFVLATLLRGTDIDRLAIANAVDENTSRAYLRR